MLVNTSILAAESGNDSPKPLVYLLGCANEARIVVEGMEMTDLVDTGSQTTALTEGFCNERGLQIPPLRNLMKGVLHPEGIGTLQYHTRDMWRLTLLYQTYPS